MVTLSYNPIMRFVRKLYSILPIVFRFIVVYLRRKFERNSNRSITFDSFQFVSSGLTAALACPWLPILRTIERRAHCNFYHFTQEAEHRSAQYAVDGGAVLRSRTADIEHMLRKQAAVKPRKISQSSELSAAAAAAGGREKARRKTSSDGAAGRHPLRIDPDPHVGERLAGGPSYRSPSPTRNVWRRKDVISSMPEHRRPYN